MWGSIRANRTVGAIAFVALAVAGCTADGSGDDATRSGGVPSERSSPTATASVEPIAVEANWYGKPVELSVGPVVVSDGIGVLHLAITGEDTFSAGIALGNAIYTSRLGPSAVRLVDIDEMSVSVPAWAGNDVVMVDGTDSKDEAMRPAVAFAAPPGDETAVLVPGLGLVEGVPVVDAADYDGPGPALTDLTKTAAEDLLAPTYPLGTFTEDASVTTRTSEERIDVAVDSDVLFAVDSADLSPEADAALTTAAAQIAGFEGGGLTIVGHTDDVGDTAANQGLSERRAQSVKDRLTALADLSAYAVTVEGRGESQPAVRGTDDTARALNRRVELLFVPEGKRVDEPVEASAGEAPTALGPVASGTESVTVTQRDKSYDVRVTEVRRTGGLLVGSLELTTEFDGNTSLLSAGAAGTRGGFAPDLQSAANRVTLLDGSTRTYPLDYEEEDDGVQPLADRIVNTTPGVPTVVTVVWPDPGTDTVTIDLPPVYVYSSDGATPHESWPPFRFTDVPVTTG